MKYFKVTVPVGYDVFKYFKGESLNDAKSIAINDLSNNFQSWGDYGPELYNMTEFLTVEEISFTDYYEFEDD
jgi:hypothetical protein